MIISSKLNSIINSKDIFNKIFLFYGEEKYYRNMYINRIKQAFGDLVKGINYIVLDDTNISNLISEVNTPAFGYENKLIIINNSKIFMSKKSKKDDKEENIENEANTLSSIENDIINLIENQTINNVTIVFNEEDINKIKKIYKVISKKGVIEEFKKLNENDISNYIIDLCQKYSVKISKPTALYFVNVCSNNMEDIINEIRKLIEYTGKSNEITKESIDLITTRNIETIIFDLTNYLGKRDIKKSIQILDNLLYQKEPLQKIYIMLYKHYRNLYYIKSAKEQNIANINQNLELHPFTYNKCLEQINNYSMEELVKIYKRFMQIDFDNKTGNVDLYIGILNTICSIK